MRITVGAENLTKLFSGEKKLEVPSFQRNYSWRSQEIELFVGDYKRAEARELATSSPIG